MNLSYLAPSNKKNILSERRVLDRGKSQRKKKSNTNNHYNFLNNKLSKSKRRKKVNPSSSLNSIHKLKKRNFSKLKNENNRGDKQLQMNTSRDYQKKRNNLLKHSFGIFLNLIFFLKKLKLKSIKRKAREQKITKNLGKMNFF